ncbi:hypothetical protein [Sphingobium baderi]|uniref:hypothetical protein n=1 Tax=Sphingobium baderi TaxID=1332080 RepID=UPI0004CEB217|nr:hypothetical protein [Sphingobium baderi]KMS64133.1 hypothetical protein V475_20295 [Sphingobium baderi LL03]
MTAAYEVMSVQTDLKRKTARIQLKGNSAKLGDYISVSLPHFDPPGVQNEGELEALAVAAAKERLIAAVASLGG